MSYLEYVTADPGSDDRLKELARTNRFTMADLEANRTGIISDSQKGRLVVQALRPLRYTGGALGGWLLCCFVVRTLVPDIVLTIAAVLGAKGLGVVFGAITLTSAAAFLVSLVKSGRKLALLMPDLKEGQAIRIEGRVSPSREDEQGIGLARLYGQNYTNTWYVLRDEYFEVDPKLMPRCEKAVSSACTTHLAVSCCFPSRRNNRESSLPIV